MELQLYREYRDIVRQFSYVVETERRFYLANQVDLHVRNVDGEVYFEVEMQRRLGVGHVPPARVSSRSVRVMTFKDVNVEELREAGHLAAHRGRLLAPDPFAWGCRPPAWPAGTWHFHPRLAYPQPPRSVHRFAGPAAIHDSAAVDACRHGLTSPRAAPAHRHAAPADRRIDASGRAVPTARRREPARDRAGAWTWPLAGNPDRAAPVRPAAPTAGCPGSGGVDLAADRRRRRCSRPGSGVVGVRRTGGRSGEVVSVDHPGGLRTTYEPVRPSVRAGQLVGAGDVIATVVAGHAGCSGARPVCTGDCAGGEVYLDPLPHWCGR